MMQKALVVALLVCLTVAYPIRFRAVSNVLPTSDYSDIATTTNSLYFKHFFAVAKSGAVSVVLNKDFSQVRTVVDLSQWNSQLQFTSSIAVHPTQAYLFVGLSRAPTSAEILQYTIYNGAVSTTPAYIQSLVRITLDAGFTATDVQVFLEEPSYKTDYNFGDLYFRSDSYLYIGFGASDVYSYAQKKNNSLGKILRINVDVADTRAGTKYSVPSTNPFNNAAGWKSEIFAYGFTNPINFVETGNSFWVVDTTKVLSKVHLVVIGGDYSTATPVYSKAAGAVYGVKPLLGLDRVLLTSVGISSWIQISDTTQRGDYLTLDENGYALSKYYSSYTFKGLSIRPEVGDFIVLGCPDGVVCSQLFVIRAEIETPIPTNNVARVLVSLLVAAVMAAVIML